MGVINKLNIDLELVEGKTINEIKYEFKTNGKVNSNYSFDSLEVYAYKDGMNACNVNNKDVLSKDYVIKSGEAYLIKFNELTFNGMEYSETISQSEEMVYINNSDISNFDSYCMGTQKKVEKYRSFAFNFSEVKENTIKTEEETTTDTENQITTDTENQTTVQLESQNQPNESSGNNFFANNGFVSFISGFILGFVIVVVTVLVVNKVKSKNK